MALRRQFDLLPADQLSRDNLDDEPATIRMTVRRRRGDEGRA